MTDLTYRDLEKRLTKLRGDDDEDELDKVEQWRTFLETHTDDGEGGSENENVE